MTHTSELGSALRYRYKSLTAVFLVATCASFWLFAAHASNTNAAGPSHTDAASVAQLAPPPQPAIPPQATADAAPTPSPSPLVLPAPDVHTSRATVAIRNPDQVKQLQQSLWSAIDRKNIIESRLAELSIPAAPIVRQPAPIATVSPELRAATARVATAKSALAELQTRYTDAYPDVIQTKDELAEAERAFYAARRLPVPAPARPHLAAPSTPSPQVAAERTALRTELEQLASTIPDLQSQLDLASSLPRHAPTPPAPPATHDTYWPLVLPHPNVQSVQPPATAAPSAAPNPDTPPAPILSARSLLFLPQSMLLGLVAAAMLFVLLESLDRTIKGPDSLKHALPADARQISLRSMRA